MEITMLMGRRFCAEVRETKIKYLLSFLICLLSYGLIIANGWFYFKLIANPGAILTLTLTGPLGFAAGIHYWIRYHEMNS